MSRRTVLYHNQLAREGRIPTRHAPFAEHVLRIPDADFAVIRKVWPGLDSTNADERSRAVEAFLASPASEPYRVRRR